MTLALVAFALGGSLPAVARHAPAPSRQQTAITQLVSAANRHQLSAVNALFMPGAMLVVSSRQMHGIKAVDAWWRGQFSHHLQLSLKSPIHVSGSGAAAVLWRITQGADCPKGCWDGLGAQFSGGRFSKVTLVKLKLPVTPSSGPPQSTPPPKAGATPTVPS